MTILEQRQSGMRIGERLIADGLVSPAQMDQALEAQRRSGGFLGSTLVSLGFVTPKQIAPFLEQATGFPFIDIGFAQIDSDVAAVLDERFAESTRVLPYKEDHGRVHVAMADPLDIELLEILRTKLGKPIVPHLALEDDLILTIKRAYDIGHQTKSLIRELGEDDEIDVDAEQEEDSEDAPVVRLLNQIVSAAVNSNASDVHIEPREENVRVRYRIDGLLYEHVTLPRHHLPPFMSRLKIMASLNIAEARRPQDGRFAFNVQQGRAVDVRVSIMPTVHGEKAVLRILEKSTDHLLLSKVGLDPIQLETIKRLIKKPHGLFLVTGPTGSGKTTTLYAALQHINDSSRNITTIEDPVEYQLPGVNQTQVNNKIGVTFAAGLRTLVRQDPDVILVGEIRDKETAEMAVQAALTGHLVLSTLHTNDAPGAVVRLLNMGVEPYLIASALIGSLSQRLLRANCEFCVKEYVPGEEIYAAAGIPFDEAHPSKLGRGAGCPRCGLRGTRGRTAASELMVMTDPLRKLILRNADGHEIYQRALIEGMAPIREAAVTKALNKEIPPEEIIRVFAQED
jgi:type II secretory ATPase GspE/PulE/Tfp pilus assembly ATPase PilB-like protein